MYLLAALSYDHMAIIGCGLALLFCIACMAIASNMRDRASLSSREKNETRSPIFSSKQPMMTP